MNAAKPADAATDAGVAQHLTEIARVLFAPGSVEDTLERIVALSVAAIDGCDEAGLCGRTTRAGRGGDLLAVLDLAQERLSEGPCVEVLGGTDSVYVDDLLDSTRWPRFGPVATRAGIRTALAYRLFDGTDTFGALQMYAHLPGAFNASDRAQGLLFAAHAGMALASARAHAAAEGKVANLQAAMLSREIIGQAQGILMERERITADQAFDLLRLASQRLNRKLADVARELVATGAVPGAGRREPRPSPPTR